MVHSKKSRKPLGGALLAAVCTVLLIQVTASERGGAAEAGETAASVAPAVAEPVDFARHVAPLLRRVCVECHQGERDEGGLRLDDSAAARQSGVIEPGNAEQSELIRRIELPQFDDQRMPAVGQPLAKSEIKLLRQWVDAGAPWPERLQSEAHWAYVVPERPHSPPEVDRWARSEIDRFVLAAMRPQGLDPSPQAEPALLLRRVHLDLIGLPPTPEEVLRFEADPSDRAYAAVVDDLLQRPQFGQHWARPWLDLARYADSHGFQRDDLRDSWPYRDWVIDALNQDMPFDRFTIEQLAGDLLPDASPSQRIATGFHRCAPTNVEAGSLPEETRVLQVIDRVNTTATVWLGTTLQCAQCHDHKYDPLSIQEYYQFYDFFNQTEIEADLTDPKKPSSIAFLGPILQLDSKGLDDKGLDDQAPEEAATPSKGTGDAKAQPKPARPSTLVMVQRASRRVTRVFERGDYRSPGEVVTAETPAVLHRLRPADVHAGVVPGIADRLSLAKWLVDPANPLVARVTVNRWWSELFGRGLVDTPEDFGIKGSQPTHPELLDLLAVEWVRSGWSMKHVLRQIVNSSTYRQSSRLRPVHFQRDAANRWLSRGPRLRLDAETIRDNALAISGVLDYRFGGPPIRPEQPAGLWTKVGGQKYRYETSAGGDAYRRGIYVVFKRGSPYPSFMNFDASARMTCTVTRSRTNTPLQALTLLNDPVYVELASAMADRAVAEVQAGRSEAAILVEWFRRCTARMPSPSEQRLLGQLLDDQRDAATGRLKRPDHAAWYAVATTLLNLHETVTKP